MEEITKDIQTIQSLNDVHQQWSYVYYVLSGKLNYLYRTIRNSKLTLKVALDFERDRKALVESILDDKLNDFQHFQMHLGITSGGFGLQSQAHINMSE